MQPQQTTPQNINGQIPQQPQPSSGPTPSPQYTPQPVVPNMPLTGQAPQNFSGIPMGNIDKERKQILWLTIGSLAVFVIGFLVGFAALLGAFLGAFGARKAKLINYNLGFVLGLIGLILNAGFYLLAVLAD